MKAGAEDDIEKVLTHYRTIAMVGASANPDRPSHGVARFLKSAGYRVIPVTPNASEVAGERAYPDLDSIPEPVEVVDIFRRPEEVPAIVEQAIRLGARAVWMQASSDTGVSLVPPKMLCTFSAPQERWAS